MSKKVTYEELEKKVKKLEEEAAGRGRYQEEPCRDCPVIESLETGDPRESEITSPDGRIWFIRAYPIRGTDGVATAIVEVTEEITARKQAEEALQESEHYFRSLLSNIREDILVIANDYRITDVNQAFLARSRHRREDVIGRPSKIPGSDLVCRGG